MVSFQKLFKLSISLKYFIKFISLVQVFLSISMHQETLNGSRVEEIPEEEQIQNDRIGEIDVDEIKVFPTESETEIEPFKSMTVEKEEMVENLHPKNMNEDENEKIVHSITEKEPQKDAPTKFSFKKIGFVLNPAAGKGKAGKEFGRYIFKIKKKNPLPNDLQTRLF
jgi:hypothetical protein